VESQRSSEGVASFIRKSKTTDVNIPIRPAALYIRLATIHGLMIHSTLLVEFMAVGRYNLYTLYCMREHGMKKNKEALL